MKNSNSIQAVSVKSFGYTCSVDDCNNVAEYSDGCEDYICQQCKDRYEKEKMKNGAK